MTVRIGNINFSDWTSLHFEDGWSDTFILRVSALACLPPFYYKEPLRRMLTQLEKIRSSASIWIQVDGPGEWFAAEVHNALKNRLPLPYAVTRAGITVHYLDFSSPPTLLYSRPPAPPVSDEVIPDLPLSELRCLQALGRMIKGNDIEIAALAGLDLEKTKTVLADLSCRGLVVYKTGHRLHRRLFRPRQNDLFPLWHILPRGRHLALQSWVVPKGVSFRTRREAYLWQIGSKHRRLARLWTAWLQSAWPLARIWTGWSEVRIPGSRVIPDGLAWGRAQGYETLFWLEVGDEHRSIDQITNVTAFRLNQAVKFCALTGVRLVYTQLSTRWVRQAVKRGCANLPRNTAVVLADWGRFGKLPILEWGRITSDM